MTRKHPETTFSLMFEMGRLMRRRMEGGTPKLSMPQFEALRFIAEHRSPSMREVAKRLKIAAPSATALVAELEEAKYVRRHADLKDRRQVLLSVTPSGGRMLARCAEWRITVLRSVLKPLSQKDHEDLNRILRKIVDNE